MLIEVRKIAVPERGCWLGGWWSYKDSARGDTGGEHMGVYMLENHQVVHLRFVQLTLGRLYLCMKKKNNDIFIDLQKQL